MAREAGWAGAGPGGQLGDDRGLELVLVRCWLGPTAGQVKQRAAAKARGALLAVALLLAAGVASAQEKVYVYDADAGGATIATAVPGGTTSYTSSGINGTVKDDKYDGSTSIPSMTCKTITVASQTYANNIAGPVTVTVPITAGRGSVTSSSS